MKLSAARQPLLLRERETVSVSVAARIAGCSVDTILHKIEEGAIGRTSARGWWKIECESLTRFLDGAKK